MRNVQINAVFSKDVAIARATHISGQQFVFVSAHAPGFDLTKTVTAEDAREGDFYCLEIAKKLSKIGCNAIQIIGADMNANPEKWNLRFQIFSENGFQIHRTGLATNINPRDPIYQEREIDFILTKTPTLVSQEVELAVEFDASVKREEVIGWNIEENASDHLPVFVNISYKTPFPDSPEEFEVVEAIDVSSSAPKRTWRERIWQGFLRCLSYLFCCCFRDSQESE